MISVSGNNWFEKKVSKNSLEKIKQDFNFSDILSRLIISKQFDHTEIFNINNDFKVVNNFKNNDDFNKGINLLNYSIKNKETICILGDYDVDGSAATSLLARFFNHINQPYFYYIPDRIKDGYGPSIKLFKKLVTRNPKLVIMVDCGSTANDSINFLNDNKIKSLIIDHHEMKTPFPQSNAIINPKKKNWI